MYQPPTAHAINPATGTMTGSTGRYEKRLRDLTGIYADDAAFSAALARNADRVVYYVHETRPAAAHGDLIFGTTFMEPGRIGEEYFVTRGHIHKKSDRPEIYYGQKGRGLMLMESPEGEVRIVAIDAQTVCYVPPYWIHRSVNVGDDELVMLFCYPADSGQDYDCIAKAGGMRVRIVEDGTGGWKQVDNPNWRMRDAATIATLYGQDKKEETA